VSSLKRLRGRVASACCTCSQANLFLMSVLLISYDAEEKPPAEPRSHNLNDGSISPRSSQNATSAARTRMVATLSAPTEPFPTLRASRTYDHHSPPTFQVPENKRESSRQHFAAPYIRGFRVAAVTVEAYPPDRKR
jgi:hypothetical protein